MLAAFAGVCWWVFLRKGLAHGRVRRIRTTRTADAGIRGHDPVGGLPRIRGHAAAARYGGATPGVMGVGVYLVWPAFYTDVTDSYRLGRGGRLRTDLGGLYFNAIVAVGMTGLWWWLRYDALLLVVATQIMQMVRQLAPMVRFDGYHVLADVTGVPTSTPESSRPCWACPAVAVGRPARADAEAMGRIVVTVWVMIVMPFFGGRS